MPCVCTAPSRPLYAFTNSETLLIWLFRVFVGILLCRQSWLNHWPLVIDPTSSPSALSWGGGGGAGATVESPSPPTMPWSFWWPATILKLSTGGQLPVISLACQTHIYCSRESKDFWSYVPGIRDKTKYVFPFILHHQPPVAYPPHLFLKLWQSKMFLDTAKYMLLGGGRTKLLLVKTHWYK